MSEVTLMEIALENCEMVIVPKECIKSFSFEEDYNWIESGEIVLQNLNKLILCSYGDIDVTGVQRLQQYNDITQVDLHYSNGDIKNISVDWKNDYFKNENTNQTTKQVDDILYINFK